MGKIKPRKRSFNTSGFGVNFTYISKKEIDTDDNTYMEIIQTLKSLRFYPQSIETIEKELKTYYPNGFAIAIKFFTDKRSGNTYINEIYISESGYMWFNELFHVLTFEYTNSHCFITDDNACRAYLAFHNDDGTRELL